MDFVYSAQLLLLFWQKKSTGCLILSLKSASLIYTSKPLYSLNGSKKFDILFRMWYIFSVQLNCFYIQTDFKHGIHMHTFSNACTCRNIFICIKLDLITKLIASNAIWFHLRYDYVYRHVWIVFFVRHSLHLTSQHQWNVHEQRSTTITSCVR